MNSLQSALVTSCMLFVWPDHAPDGLLGLLALLHLLLAHVIQRLEDAEAL
jgi:hypothetical protein